HHRLGLKGRGVGKEHGFRFREHCGLVAEHKKQTCHAAIANARPKRKVCDGSLMTIIRAEQATVWPTFPAPSGRWRIRYASISSGKPGEADSPTATRRAVPVHRHREL